MQVKYFFAIFLFGLFFLKVNAQNTFPATGNVGVGTNSPGSQLTVEKAATNPVTSAFIPKVTVKTTSINESVQLGFEETASAGNYPRVYFSASTATSNSINSGFVNQLNGVRQWFFGMSNDGTYGGTGGSTAGRFMGYYDYVTGTWKYGFNASGEMYLGASSTTYGIKLSPSGASVFMGGNVGVGTKTPAGRISLEDVDATTSPIGITWYNNNGTADPTAYGIHRTSGAWTAPNYQQLRMGWNTGIVLDPGTAYGKCYVDIKGNGLRVTSGNVGIGIETPQAKLDVNGNASLLTGTHKMYVREAASFDPLQAGFRNNEGNLVMNAKNNGILFLNRDVAAETRIQSTTGATTLDIAVFKPNGQVGIGTLNTTDVAYKLFVETGIRTRKVKVDVVSWADYVFEPTYKLPTLPEVEAFIKTHKHLPDVPSAEEVRKEGIDLGENQSILLKKIEELTLYVIELKKENEALKERNKSLDLLKKEVEDIRNLLLNVNKTK